jgi:prepilin-type N-terminal cleavage/methylation domain-containing protein
MNACTVVRAHGRTVSPTRRRPCGQTPDRARGFTLVELLVALTVGSLVVLLAHRTFAVAGDLAGRVAARREVHDRDINARGFLARAFGSLEVGLAPNGGFRGLAEDVSFTSWLRSPDDTLRRHGVRIAATPDGVIGLVTPLRAGSAFAPDTLRLFPQAEEVGFDYLLDFGADAAWVHEWQSPVSAPLAVRLRLARGDGAVDTLLFAIGPRG